MDKVILYIRQYLFWIGIIWIIYSLKSASTSKRKNKNVFAENINLSFVKKMQVICKTQGLSIQFVHH